MERSYKSLTREWSGRHPEMAQSDTKLDATADQEIVDVILSGRVSTASLSPPLLFPFTLLPFPSLRFPSFLSLPNPPLSFQTEHHLQPAWEFSGRVRISDGLVVLVRQPVRHQHALCPYHDLSNGPCPVA